MKSNLVPPSGWTVIVKSQPFSILLGTTASPMSDVVRALMSDQPLTLTEIAAWTSCSALGFQAIFRLLRYGCGQLANSRLPLSKQSRTALRDREQLLYLLSLVNAVQASAVGIWKFSLGEARWNDARANRQSVSLLNGYFLADLFLAETWSTDVIFHHSVGLITTEQHLLYLNRRLVERM